MRTADHHGVIPDDACMAVSAAQSLRNGHIQREIQPKEASKLSPSEIYERVSPSVVAMKISPDDEGKIRHKSMDLDSLSATYGSGFVYDSEKRIVVTNWHVARVEKDLIVKVGEERLKATLLAADPKNDIAILRVDGDSPLPPAPPRGKPTALKVGERVYTLGSPFGFDRTLGDGIISGPPRTLHGPNGVMVNLVQHNAVTNPGNSGGVLVNEQGEIVAMNTMILSQSGGHQGFALSVPIDLLERSVTELLEGRKLVEPALGVVVAEAKGQKGLAIVHIKPGSSVDKAGLSSEVRFKKGDTGSEVPDFTDTVFIERVNGRAIREGSDITAAIARSESSSAELELRIGQRHFSLSIEPDMVELPDVIAAQQVLSRLDRGPGCEHALNVSANEPLTNEDVAKLLTEAPLVIVHHKPRTPELGLLNKKFGWGRGKAQMKGDEIPIDVYADKHKLLANLLEAGHGLRWLEDEMKKLDFKLEEKGETLHFVGRMFMSDAPRVMMSLQRIAHGSSGVDFAGGEFGDIGGILGELLGGHVELRALR